MDAMETELCPHKNACFAAWRQRFDRLQQWLDDTGGVYPSDGSIDPDELLLHQWVERERRSCCESWQRDLLAGLIDWSWNLLEQKWRNNWRALKIWLAKNPGLGYPSRTDPREMHLSRWVNEQRRAFKAGKLAQHRESRMYELPGWSWSDSDSPWMPAYTDYETWLNGQSVGAQASQMHHLRCSARRKGRQRERDLFAWVNGTHAAYMRSNGQRISPYQKRFLDELPFFRQTWPHRFDMT